MVLDIFIAISVALFIVGARVYLAGLYLALEYIKDDKELFPKKEELFKILFSYYIATCVLYAGYILHLLYKYLAPILQF